MNLVNPDNAIPLAEACAGSHKPAPPHRGKSVRCPACKQRVPVNLFGNVYRHRAGDQ